jgi:hypothetical protein
LGFSTVAPASLIFCLILLRRRRGKTSAICFYPLMNHGMERAFSMSTALVYFRLHSLIEKRRDISYFSSGSLVSRSRLTTVFLGSTCRRGSSLP